MLVTVIIPQRLPYRLTYNVPQQFQHLICCGARVAIPTPGGSKHSTTALISHVLTQEEETKFFETVKGKVIKEILSLIDTSPIVTINQLRLWEWISAYYMCSDGETMSYFMPKELIIKGVITEDTISYKKSASLSKERFVTLKEGFDVSLLKNKQKELIDYFFNTHNKLSVKELYNAGFNSSHLLKAIQNGLLSETFEKVFKDTTASTASFSEIAIPEKPDYQEEIDARLNLPLLIKSEGNSYVYMIHERLQRGESVLILISEEAKFSIPEELKERTISFLSTTSPSNKYKNYCTLLNGEAHVIVGNRLAVGLPYKNLSLIIVHDEHSTKHKSETPPRFHARDAALMLSHLCHCDIVLESFAPSIESYYNTTIGKYNFLDLSKPLKCSITPINKYSIASKERKVYGNIPQVRYFSKFLLTKMQETIVTCGRTLLFHNRRGYNSFLICKDCGWVYRCKNCNVSMTYHKEKQALICHYCGDKSEPITICGGCGSKNLQLKGVGSENIEESIKKYFPLTTVLRLDSDQLGKVENAREAARIIKNGEANIIVGTWLTIPYTANTNFSLIGIVDADTLFNIDDFRAEERAFRVIVQLAQRADGGKMVIQCSNINRPILHDIVKGDYTSMANRELEIRKKFAYPPYIRSTRIYIKHREEEKALEIANRLSEEIRQKTGIDVSCPNTPIVDKVRGMYLFYITLKFAKSSKSEQQKKEIIKLTEKLQDISIDVDY